MQLKDNLKRGKQERPRLWKANFWKTKTQNQTTGRPQGTITKGVKDHLKYQKEEAWQQDNWTSIFSGCKSRTSRMQGNCRKTKLVICSGVHYSGNIFSWEKKKKRSILQRLIAESSKQQFSQWESTPAMSPGIGVGRWTTEGTHTSPGKRYQ